MYQVLREKALHGGLTAFVIVTTPIPDRHLYTLKHERILFSISP